MGIGADAAKHAEQERGGMADREHRDIKDNVLQPPKQQHHAQQKQDVVISRNHVLGAEIEKGKERRPRNRLNKGTVTARDIVRHRQRGHDDECRYDNSKDSDKRPA